MAIAHQILIIAYAVVTRGESYEDARLLPYHQPDIALQYVRKLERLGYRVSIQPAA